MTGTKVLSCLDKKEVKATLSRRGIQPINEDGLVSIEQAYLVNILLDNFDNRSPREKLKALKEATGIDITYAQYNAWMKDPNFVRYLTKRAEIQFDGLQPTVKNRLVKLVEAGNLEAIKYVQEMTGAYNPRQNELLDMRKLFAQIIDILTRHCTPEVLHAVATELELLGAGSFNRGTPELAPPSTPVVDTTERFDADFSNF